MENYEMLEMEIVIFEGNDIIITSPGDTEWTPGNN